MFNVLKPIIEKNKLFDEKIVELCADISKVVKEGQNTTNVSDLHDHLDYILGRIDDLETDCDFTEEIDDLKEDFITMDKSLEVYAKYKNESAEEMQKKIDTFFKWSN